MHSKSSSPIVALITLLTGIVFYTHTLTWQSVSSTSHPNNNMPSTANTSRNLPATVTNTTTTTTTTIAYVVTITGCGSLETDIPFPIAEGAAVLQHSIHRQHRDSAYNYQMYALYHPEAYECAQTLRPLGYHLLERSVLINVDDIKGEFLRTHISKNGCCGEKELLKLEAYTLTEHPLVVLLDLDTLLLQPLDVLFDILLHKNKNDFSLLSREQLQHLFMTNDQTEDSLNALLNNHNLQVMHTLDYAMVQPSRKIKPFQGGFVILKPDKTVYEEFREIVRVGDFRDKGGWGGQTGKFWGGQTFQGIMPYYYHILHPGQSIALNWCTFNNMGSPSRNQGIVNDQPEGKCYTGEAECEDCRARDISTVALVHYTVCQKPWICMRHAADALANRLCRQFHHAWFRERSWTEQSWGRSGNGTGTFDADHFYGYCTSSGKKGYQLIGEPYGNR